MTSAQAFAGYESVRARLPAAGPPGPIRRAANLDHIADDFDVFLLDAFGVLNIGEAPIPGVPARVATLQAAGKQVLVVTNAASTSRAALVAKYVGLGYTFAPDAVISSREVLLSALRTEPDRHWGVMGNLSDHNDDLHGLNLTQLADDPATYHQTEAILMLGSANWTPARQSLLQQALHDAPRPLWVGNPDIVAPREQGFSIEPGHYAHAIADRTGITPQFFGKPFANVYDHAFARLGPVDRKRVVMVGDSLHTDVLGAHAAGIASALIAGYGFFAGQRVETAIEQAGITPTFILDRP